ncbi:soluble cytochrome b562 [Pseudoalteromonas sp. SW0106-04]|uniref:cytochrome b562 n=1 Tax=Pseudoalteromonas sp. SW0106-04 TaxID=1702169 RepID=UPI0006B4C09E|nr:cytochrome b562 [Pseudoalteromonas sp. SW0106-04]GAP73540.1 soluble cytochrome b562 [Pseudoalteromonas sp. SW0106-04]
MLPLLTRFSALILFTLPCLSQAQSQQVDLEAVMKNMGHSYKQAMEAQQPTIMSNALKDLKELVQEAKRARFSKEAEQSQQGLDKVLERIASAEQQLAQGQLEAARETLKDIDTLRKKYHELHEPPGFWELLFG